MINRLSTNSDYGVRKDDIMKEVWKNKSFRKLNKDHPKIVASLQHLRDSGHIYFTSPDHLKLI
jgi:hypothetical protein